MLIYLALYPSSTVRIMSDMLDISERQVSRVIKDMTGSGVITVVRRTEQGNSYAIDRSKPFPDRAIAHLTLGQAIDALATAIPIEGAP